MIVLGRVGILEGFISPIPREALIIT